jgi:hypothetical protein
MVRYVRHLLVEALGEPPRGGVGEKLPLPHPQRGLPVWEVYDVAGLADV